MRSEGNRFRQHITDIITEKTDEPAGDRCDSLLIVVARKWARNRKGSFKRKSLSQTLAKLSQANSQSHLALIALWPNPGQLKTYEKMQIEK